MRSRLRLSVCYEMYSGQAWTPGQGGPGYGGGAPASGPYPSGTGAMGGMTSMYAPGSSDGGEPGAAMGGVGAMEGAWAERDGTSADVGLAAVACDLQEERFWAGTDDGRLISFAYRPNYESAGDSGSSLVLYCSAAVADESQAVTSVLPSAAGALALSPGRVQLRSRGGLLAAQWTIVDVCGGVAQSEGRGLHAIAEIPRRNGATHFVVGGKLPVVCSFDMRRGGSKPVSSVAFDHDVTHVVASDRAVVCASTIGTIDVLDGRLRTTRVQHSFPGHAGGVADMCSTGSTVVTCGYSKRGGGLIPEAMLKVFDIRMNRAMPFVPLSLRTGAVRLAPLPQFPSTVMAATQFGDIQLVDLAAEVSAVGFAQVDTGGYELSGLCVSATGTCAAAVDKAGGLHVLADRSQFVVSGGGEFAEPPHEGVYSSLSYSADGYPTCAGDPSAWRPLDLDEGAGCRFTAGAFLAVPDPSNQHISSFDDFAADPFAASNLISVRNDEPLTVWPTLSLNDAVFDDAELAEKGYAANPGYLPNSLLARWRASRYDRRGSRGAHSPRKTARGRGGAGGGDVAASDDLPIPFVEKDPRARRRAERRARRAASGADLTQAPVILPRPYRKPHIRLSFMGISGFDFSIHNGTPFAGLEDSGPNSFANSLLQALYFCREMRGKVTQHACDNIHCIVCELRFVFVMLDQGQRLEPKHRSVLATNFARVFRMLPQATALDLVDPCSLLPAVRINRTVRFLLERVASALGGGAKPDRKSRGGGGAASEAESLPDTPDALFGFDVSTVSTCPAGHKTTLQQRSTVISLAFPESSTHDPNPSLPSFAKLLRGGLSEQRTQRAWCRGCDDYVILNQHKAATQLPHMLAVSCATAESFHFDMWRAADAKKVESTKVPEGAASVSLADGVARVREEAAATSLAPGSAASTPASADEHVDEGAAYANEAFVEGAFRATITKKQTVTVKVGEGSLSGPMTEQSKLYELVGVVAYVDASLRTRAGLDPDDDDDWDDSSDDEVEERAKRDSHYVATLRVGSVEDPTHDGFGPSGMGGAGAAENLPWYIFNDFRVTQTSDDDARRFADKWKLPCFFLYRSTTAPPKRGPLEPPSVIGPECFGAPAPIVQTPRTLGPAGATLYAQLMSRAITLTPSELPGKGDLVAIDAEFVALDVEEAHIRADGSRKVITPARLAPGRISLCTPRDDAPDDVNVIMDDYIVSTEPVADYLTRFSGLTADDLDPSVSPHPLVHLKTSYLRLQALVDRGCIFVGHGLVKDFRTINIIVPPEQVVDTVELLRLPAMRLASLRYLSAYFLSADIQGAVHDSVEDAKSALLLYKKYCEMRDAGTLQAELEKMYEEGRTNGWNTVRGKSLG